MMSKRAILLKLGEAALRRHLAEEHYALCYLNMVRLYPYVDDRLRPNQPAQATRIEKSAIASEISRQAKHEIKGWAFIFKQRGFKIPNEPRFILQEKAKGKKRKP